MTSWQHDLIDIGANLLDPMFRGQYRGKQAHEDDFDLMIKRARHANVKHIMVTAGSLQESREALQLALSKPEYRGFLYSTVGVHPTRAHLFESDDAEDAEQYLQHLIDLAKSGKQKGVVVAVGECGLDYGRSSMIVQYDEYGSIQSHQCVDRLHFCDKDVQKRHFQKHFRITEETKL